MSGVVVMDADKDKDDASSLFVADVLTVDASIYEAAKALARARARMQGRVLGGPTKAWYRSRLLTIGVSVNKADSLSALVATIDRIEGLDEYARLVAPLPRWRVHIAGPYTQGTQPRAGMHVVVLPPAVPATAAAAAAAGGPTGIRPATTHDSGTRDPERRVARWHVGFAWPELTGLVERGCRVVLDVDRHSDSLVLDAEA